ncbi:MAG: hypothetical protein DIU80_020775 [Chloroflexota bacterium]|mgnify:CR=1 FL=1
MSKKKSSQGKMFGRQGGAHAKFGGQKPGMSRGVPMSRRPPRQPGR